MVNSGVSPGLRRRGIYSRLVEATIAHADSHGFFRIISRHVPSNNAVIIPKLRLGFMVSGFEYSEVYGPLVRLTYLIGHKRRELYRARSMPVVPSGAEAQRALQSRTPRESDNAPPRTARARRGSRGSNEERRRHRTQGCPFLDHRRTPGRTTSHPTTLLRCTRVAALRHAHVAGASACSDRRRRM